MSANPFFASEGRYALQVPDFALTFHVDRLRRERHELVGELTVRAPDLAGAATVNGVLNCSDFNLSSARARQDRARLLSQRSKAPDLDWFGLLEELCLQVMEAERTGTPAVDLRAVACPARTDTDWVVSGFHLPRRHPSIAFGDGGSLKSYVALYLLGDLHRRFGLRVGLFDWELDAEDHRIRLAELFGEDDLPSVTYARCDRPLVQEVDRLRRIVQEAELDYVAYDSIAFACDGPPEAAETAGAYFRAVRQIGAAGLHLAHTTKSGEDNDKRPFGSTFWFNGCRACWFMKRAESIGPSAEVDVGILPRKANLGPQRPAFGLRATFTEGRVRVGAVDVATIDDVSPKLPIWQRARQVLRSGPRPLHAVAEAVGADTKSVEKALVRGEGKHFTRTTGPNGVFEWANLDPRAA